MFCTLLQYMFFLATYLYLAVDLVKFCDITIFTMLVFATYQLFNIMISSRCPHFHLQLRTCI